jgi:hypothetical protein
LLTSSAARADDARVLASAIVLGSVAGLAIGAVYLAGSYVRPTAATPSSAAVAGPVAVATPAAGLKGAAVQSVPGKAAPPLRIAVKAVASSGFVGFLRGRVSLADGLVAVAARPFHFRQAEAQTDQNCLAEAVYFEARGEPEAGQEAVAQVVLNRVRHPAFPKSVCGVVHQRTVQGCQFAFACRSDRPALASAAWRRSEEVALAALHGSVMTAVGDATHFQSARGGAFAGLMKVAQVGAHVFYRFAGHAGAPAMFHATPVASSPTEATSAHVEQARVEQARLDQAKAEPAHVQPSHLDATRVELAKADPKPEAAHAEPAKAEVARIEPPPATGARARSDLKPDAIPARIVVVHTEPAAVNARTPAGASAAQPPGAAEAKTTVALAS